MKYSLQILTLLAVVSLNLVRSAADESDSDGEEEPTGGPEAKSGYESQGYGYEHQSPQVFYGGQYGGRCDQDGFYYNDENSFIMCNHGIAYAQQCAPGTRNGMASQYRAGGYYTHTAFCDINLVDFGYAAYHSQRGGGGGGGYGRSSQSGYGQASQGGYGQASQSGYGQAMTVGYKPSSGYGQSSYNSQSYGSMPHGNQGYGSSRYGGYSLYKTATSYKQPKYQVLTYRPSYTSYKPSYQTSYGQPQGHSSYGRKYSGYYTQRRYHSQPAMKY